MMKVSQTRSRCRRQRGYMLLTVMLMAALILVALSVELPAISQQIRHDREEELIHRGAQYARAIKKYYKKFGAYPVSLEQLESANHMRFLRKRYKDPMTGEDFRLLHVGEVQISLTPQNSLTGASTSGTSTSPFGTSMSTQATSSPLMSQAAGGQGDSQAGKSGTQSGASSFVSSTSGLSGPKFGGGPIIGVASTSKKQSMHVFNKKDHYADWVFFYDPTFDRGQGLITGPYNGPPTWGGSQMPRATTPGQMNPGQSQTPATSGNPSSGLSTFGQQR
jgi:type II secretory pathway pseudopilin PulG